MISYIPNIIDTLPITGKGPVFLNMTWVHGQQRVDMLAKVAVPTIPAEEEEDQEPTAPGHVCLP